MNNTIVTAYNTNSSFSSGSIGMDLDSSSYNNVSNNRITSRAEMSPGIEIDSASNSNTVENNTVRTLGEGSAGIVVVSSNSNTLLDNMVASLGPISAGISLRSSGSTGIRGGSIVSGQYYDYYLYGSGATNNFSATNFTRQRRLRFADGESRFNYNASGIWLKTSIAGGSRGINRTLGEDLWSKTGIVWNDTNESAATAVNYEITGLLANTQYHVRNASAEGSTYAHMLTADQSGNLPAFAIGLSGNTNVMVHVCHDCMCNLTASGRPGQSMENATVVAYDESGGAILDFELNSSVTSKEWVFDGERKYRIAYRLSSGNSLEIENASMMMNVTINPRFIDSYSGPLPASTSARSYVIALDDSDIMFERAQIGLQLSGAANRILHCLSWNFSSATCSSWESRSMSDYNAAANSTYVRFNVTMFDAYMAAYYGAPQAVQQQTGSGSGGGGGGGGSASYPPPYVKSLSTIPDDDGLTLVVDLKPGLLGPSVTAEWLSSVPEPPHSSRVYRYLNVTKTGFDDSEVENATVGFRVNRSWLNSNGIIAVYLARYDAGWKKLRTERVNSTAEYNEYIAYTKGFSYFAVVGEPAKYPVAANATFPAGENATGRPTPQLPGKNPAPLGNPSGRRSAFRSVGFGPALVLVVLAGVLAAFLLAANMNKRIQGKEPSLRAHSGKGAE